MKVNYRTERLCDQKIIVKKEFIGQRERKVRPERQWIKDCEWEEDGVDGVRCYWLLRE